MATFEVSAKGVKVDIENGTVLLLEVELAELATQFNADEWLDAIDFSHVHDYVIQKLKEDKEDEE